MFSCIKQGETQLTSDEIPIKEVEHVLSPFKINKEVSVNVNDSIKIRPGKLVTSVCLQEPSFCFSKMLKILKNYLEKSLNSKEYIIVLNWQME